MHPPADDGGFARWLAAHAGEELMALREDLGYADPAALRRTGDRRSHELLVEALARWRPGDRVLSEEASEDPAVARRRVSAERVWIVDPLDGTREFGEPGRDDWAVHVALWTRVRGLAAGAVALPALGRVLSTDRPPAYPSGAVATSGAAGRSGDPPPRLVVSRTRPPRLAAEVAREIGAALVPMGSAGAKIAAVVTGAADGYLHAGGQYEWDSAAPVAVANATGLHTSRIDGSKLEYNQLEPWLPDLLVCRRELADRLLAAVARHRRPGSEGE